MRLFEHANYKFIEKRKTLYVVSALLILVGIGGMIANVFAIGSWVAYGVDFTGGSLVQVQFQDAVDASDLRSALGGASAPPITRFGDASLHEFVIRAPLQENTSIDEVAARVQDELRTSLPGHPFTVQRTELVGAKVGGELQQKALMAILFSFAITLLYLAIRFELRFGIAAIIATAHDILITLGFLAVFRVEIALPSVAAILTMLGYSLNDTIIVFDRIRENMGKKGARKRDQMELIDESINETLPRTILTSGTTVAVLLALLLLGGAVIRDFTIVLILGVVIGTYSSIFVASPALIEIQKRWGTGEREEEEAPRARDGVTEYFDSHCHLTDAAFRDDREAVLRRATEAGVSRMVTIASDVVDARAAVELARDRAGVWCTAGVHPHEAGAAGPSDMEAVRELATSHEEVVALGETGLDFHYDNAPRSVQVELFDAHLALGAETGAARGRARARRGRGGRGRAPPHAFRHAGRPALLHGGSARVRGGDGRRLVRLVLRHRVVQELRGRRPAPGGARGPASRRDGLAVPCARSAAWTAQRALVRGARGRGRGSTPGLGRRRRWRAAPPRTRAASTGFDDTTHPGPARRGGQPDRGRRGRRAPRLGGEGARRERARRAEPARVDVLIERGGKRRVRVSDDGVGMGREDALLCLDRHATSKISAASRPGAHPDARLPRRGDPLDRRRSPR